MEKLPTEIMLDILSRLPHETIINCKLVSKPLRDITNYINEGFIFQSGNNPALICYGGGEKYDDVTSQGNYSYKTIIQIDNKHPSIELQPSLSAMVGSCNGLVCCLVKGKSSLERQAIYICNPVTEEYVYLPTFKNYNKAYIAKMTDYFHYGFGYHHSSNEYKVVRTYYDTYQRLMRIGSYDEMVEYKCIQVQVYTLGSGHGWRDIGRIDYHLDYISGVCANGALHWIEDRKEEIVAFDLADEKFRLIPFPPLSRVRTYKVVYLQLMFGGSLCVVHIDVGEEDGTIHVWALEKKKKFSGSYDTGEQNFNDFWGWNEKFSIPCAKDARYFPFVVTKSNQVLMFSPGGTVFRYDLGTEELRKLWDNCPMRDSRAIAHVNSLVSVQALEGKSKREK